MSYNIGILWDREVEWNDTAPFQIKNLDKDYAKYSELGRERDLEFYIAKYKWYRDQKLEKAWYWNGEEWTKKTNIKLQGVFDKYKYTDETKQLKEEIANNLPVLNDPELEWICKDKLETYELFKEFVPETKIATQESLEEMLEKYDKVVFKPRYGASGVGIEFLEEVGEFEEPENPEEYVLQRFVETDGFKEVGIEGPHDMRTHIIDGELQQGNYVRVPDEGLQSNISQGGNQKYIKNSQIPGSALEIIETAIDEFKRFDPHLFSVDIMFDKNQKPWLVELNSKPAMYYHYPVKKKEHELPRIKKLVKTLEKLVKTE